jgi:hypothetical protein
MASGKSTYLDNAVSNYVAHATAMPAISGLWYALFPADPGASGTASTEFTTSTFPGYTGRIQITPGTVSAGSYSNTNDISWTNTGGSSVSVGGAGVFDSSSGGNCLYHEGFASPYSVGANQTIDFPAGNITIGEA